MDDKILKILHFVWLGDIVPDYKDYVFDAFKQVNPDFELRLHWFNISKIERPDTIEDCSEGKIMEKSIARLLSKSHDGFIQNQLRLYGDNVRFLQILSDVVRLEVLNEYGGIYLDLDTFPIRPFDDWLLEKDFFVVDRSGGLGCYLDNYFMGKKSRIGYVVNPYDVPGEVKIVHNPANCNTVRFMTNKIAFFNKKLKIGDYSFSKDFWFDHYCDGRWRDHKRMIQIQRCKYDFDDTWKR